jgi:DNA replication and repair protein RecF
MILTAISLQHFRSYANNTFRFDPQTTLIIGPNTAGKTNLIEAVSFLLTGKSFRSETDMNMIRLGQELGRVKGKIESDETIELEVTLTRGVVNEMKTPLRRFLVNGIPRRRIDFTGKLPLVLFKPDDLEIVIGNPSERRAFMDDILEQVSNEYRRSLLDYTRALRQRNALLEHIRETGRKMDEQLSYWNEMLIENGQFITFSREELLQFLQQSNHDLFPYELSYDKSVVSEERLLQYQEEEVAAANTLVGPHRDDFLINMISNGNKHVLDVRYFGSRGQQRLAILELKRMQIAFIEQKMGIKPLLLLDDVFSELDQEHIDLVLGLIGKQQTIITTTHEEFVKKSIQMPLEKIHLDKK